MLIKCFAMGFIADKNCYMKDTWNVLDATVVSSSVAAMFPNVQNVSVLRTFRLFRPLRSLKRLPSMRILVVTLLNSLWSLSTIFLLLGFCMLAFAMVGL